MTTITKVRLQGFKSFAKLTEFVFPQGFSCVIGANGSGKSNICDAICFVLGKSSAKEMRAERSSHLIYNGGKHAAPAKEARVEIFFDNSKKEFPIQDEIVKIARIVRHSGQSIYKINEQTVTRQQILDSLSIAKIDPDGHNIILQGDIVHFMEMKPLERREIIEEIAGISIYENKKAKSLNELDKVEARLKEADIILAEREGNLRELKKDRDNALKFKELEEKIKDDKATYIHLQISEKEGKIKEVEKKIEDTNSKIAKVNEVIKSFRENINKIKEEIKNINLEIEEKGEKEQVELRKKIELYKTDIVRFKERIFTCQNELGKIENRKLQLKSDLFDNQDKVKSLKQRKEELESQVKIIKGENIYIIDKLRKLKLKNEEIIRQRFQNQSLKEITGDTAVKRILSLNEEGIYGTISQLAKVESKYSLALEVAAGSRIKSIVVRDDIIAAKCIRILKENKLGTATFLPLNKIRKREQIKSINDAELAINLVKFDKKYEDALSYVFGSTFIVKDIETARKIGIGKARMVTLDGDLLEQSGAMIGGYRKQLFGFKEEKEEEIKDFGSEIYELEEKRANNERRAIEFSSEIKNILIQINNMISPETEKTNKILVQHEKEKEEFKNELKELEEKIKQDEKKLKEFENTEKKFYSRNRELIVKRTKLTESIETTEEKIQKEEERKKTIELVTNNFSIVRAKIVGEMEGLQKELEPFKDGKIRTGMSLEKLKVQIQECERTIKVLGNVNLRALEIYDNIEKEYNELLTKSAKLKVEKEDVLKMIAEIEEKKKEIFVKTFDIINTNFKNIFLDISTKGEAYLQLEDYENPFNAGIEIKVRLTGNKFLDIHSLSGGEKTLTALSLIFAIQEYEPASFYLLDEVDAALDKANSDKLSNLIGKYSKTAQYIVISHNDNIISEANQIYGVSMQEGISKIISLKV